MTAPALQAAALLRLRQDHAIRRALGWEAEPGTLALLRNEGGETWTLRIPGDPEPCWFAADTTDPRCGFVPALAGVTDPDEARAAICADLCNERGET